MLAASLALLALLLTAPAPASADTGFGEIGVGAGQLSFPRGDAVSAQSGDVYVADASSGERVDQFDSSGAFIRAFGSGVAGGAAAGSGDLTFESPFVANVTTTGGAFLVGEAISGPGIPPGTRILRVGLAFDHDRATGPTELRLSKPAERTEEGVALSVAADPGNVAVNERQQLTVKATGGTFTLAFASPRPSSSTATTAPLEVKPGESKPSAAELQAALEALPNLGSGAVSVSGGPADEAGAHPYAIEFQGRYADVNVSQLEASSAGLSGGAHTATVETAREGATAVESCTASCVSGAFSSEPGGFWSPEAIAVDNDPGSSSYGDLYVADRENRRVEKLAPDGEFLLMFGREVDQGPHHPGDLCTAAYLAEGDVCGEGTSGTGQGQFKWPNRATIATGPGGAVYVGDAAGRVQEFSPAGAFLREIPVAAGHGVEALAVDSAGDLYLHSASVAGVQKLDSAGALQYTLDAAGSPDRLAVDAAGDLFLGEEAGGEYQLRSYTPLGALYARFSSEQIEGFKSTAAETESGRVEGIALNAAGGTLYAANQFKLKHGPLGGTEFAAHVAAVSIPTSGPPAVAKQSVDAIEPETATLRGVVNPRGFAAHYRFEYVDRESFEREGGFSSPHTVSEPASNSAANELEFVNQEDAVQAPVSGLSPATSYRWRLRAESSEGTTKGEGVPGGEGQDGSFETLPPVSVREFTTLRVAPEEAVLEAELSNDASIQEAHYRICIGTDTSYGTGCVEGTLPAGSSAFEPKQATFTGLDPNTTYHYILSAENAYTSPAHRFETEDLTFTTEPSAAEEHRAELAECPNVLLREENGSTALPDCRAYEQVSPPDKEGGEAYSNPRLAPSGERVWFESAGAFAGAVKDLVGAEYLAHRSAAGWVTEPVFQSRPTVPGYQPGNPENFSAGLDRWAFRQNPGFDEGTATEIFAPSGFLSIGLADGSYLLHASPEIAPLEGEKRRAPYFMGVKGSSEDLSRLFLYTSSRDLPAPADPRPDNYHYSPAATTRIYTIAGATGPSPALSLAAEVPLHLITLGHSGDAGDCELDDHAEGIGKAAARRSSADGSVLLYTAPIEGHAGAVCGEGTANPVGLFACDVQAGPCVPGVPGAHLPSQLNLAPASQCHAGHLCATAQPRSPSYDGASPDARLAWFTTKQPLVDADADATGDLYLAKLGESGQLESLLLASAGEASAAHPVPGEGAGVLGVAGISADGTHAAFIATGVLTEAPNSAGSRAAAGAENLYVYDAGSETVEFVARLCSGPGKSGALAEPACPAGLEAGSGERNDLKLRAGSGSSAFTPSGGDLLFASYGQLTSDDTDEAADVYRFDFASGRLVRLSFGRDGNDANGNDDRYPAEIPGQPAGASPEALAADQSRAISADGSTAVFLTGAPLTASDINGGPKAGCTAGFGAGEGFQPGCDAYVWEEQGHGSCHRDEDGSGGCLRLLSDGLDPHGVRAALIGSSGTDITFYTLRGEVPGDTDGVGDVYDARVEGGFPPPPPPPPCSPRASGAGAETCHGSSTEEKLPINPVTEGVEHGPEPIERPCKRGYVRKHGHCVKVRKHKKHKRRHRRRAVRLNRGGRK